MTATETPGSSAYSTVDLEVSDGVATITLARPGALNALNLTLKRELGEVVQEVGTRADVRSVVLTGQGRAFCAGGDITEMDVDQTAPAFRARHARLLEGTLLPLARLAKPVVAAVNGHAFGAGVSLAMACDVVVAADDAVFSFAFARVGLVPDLGALYFLTRRMAPGTAKELVFSARRFGAVEAERLGLVHEVTSAGDVLRVARERAVQYAAGPTVALGMAKTLIDQATAMSLNELCDAETYAQALAHTTADHHEGVAAFLEKRAPVFVGA